MGQGLDELTYEQRKEFLQMVVEEVIVHRNDKVVIALAIPIETDILHIRLRVSKEPAILHDGYGRGIHERRQLSHRAHKTISRCRELASARQRRQLSARLHTLQLIQAHSSPLAILVTSDDPKDTRYPGAGWSPPIRSSTCRNTSRGTATSARSLSENNVLSERH